MPCTIGAVSDEQPGDAVGRTRSDIQMSKTIAGAIFSGANSLASLAAALTLMGAGQIIPGNAGPPGPRTGMIVGQVMDAASGTPVSEAIVNLVLQGYSENAPSLPNLRVMADAEGRFFFAELPAGDYYLQATKDGYARGEYGQRRPWGQSQRVSLGEGERRTDIELRVWKYAVIGGTVVDEAGEAVVGVAVRALVRDVFAGQIRYGNMEVIPELAPAAITDDRGQFRLPQLSPGTYVVLVPSTQATVPATYLVNPDATLRTELFWGGIQEMSALGQPRTVQMGDFALMTLNRALIPPPPTPEGRMQVYGTTYYPAASTAGAAQPVSVKAGEERTDLSITLQPVPGVRISGRLVTPDGSVPPPTMIRLEGAAMNDVVSFGSPNGPDYVGLETATGMSDGRGRFSFLGVPPGDYVLRQASRFLSRFAREGKTAYWISQPITVGKEDIQDLTVELRPALRVAGRFELRGEKGAQSAPPLAGLVVFETPFGEPGQFAVEVPRDTRSFSTVAAGGRYIIRPVQRGGWFVQSVTLDGKDITDRVFDLQSDTTSFVVTYTDRPSKVSGSVTDSKGTPSATAVVLAFPVDPQRWSGYGGSPRTLQSALTTRTGVYTFEHLPPGDYFVIAIDGSELDGWRDPARLEAFAADATRLSIRSSDALTTVDLRLRGIP